MRRAIASIGAVLLTAGLVGAVAARADDTTNLSSFDLATSAAALRWQVDLKASPIPAEHTVDLSMPLSRAPLSAGPARHAPSQARRASQGDGQGQGV